MSLISITLTCPSLTALYHHLQQTLNGDTPDTVELRRHTMIRLRYWIEWHWFGETVLEPFGSDLSHLDEENLDEVGQHFLDQFTNELEMALAGGPPDSLLAIVPVSAQGTVVVFLHNDERS